MDEDDRKKLQVNRSFIVKNLHNVTEVSSLLNEYEVFTDGMREDVDVQKTREEKVRRLLDIVPRRGPKAFQGFLKALVNSQNEFVAEALMSGASSIHIQNDSHMFQQNVEVELPAIWPDERLMTEPVQVIPSQSSQRSTSYCYNMMSNPRGRVLLINNKIFYGPLKKDENGKNQVMLQTREGTDRDEERVKALFSQLHFQVEVHKDLKAEQIIKVLENEISLPIHSGADCFVLVIMTHGLKSAIYGVDGKTVEIQTIKQMLNGQNFPSMASKPKIVMIQACRGENKDDGVTVSTNKEVDKTILAMKNLHLDTASDSSGEHTEPSMGHMVVAMATTLGMVSYRNRSLGSWFLQAVVYVFQKYAHKDDLSDLLVKVNALVSKGVARTQNGGENKAVSEFHSTFVKKFYFFPGVFGDMNYQSRIQHPTS